jgi:8-oxo-dGTP pyrophosphatase MutT (NUDIX family)
VQPEEIEGLRQTLLQRKRETVIIEGFRKAAVLVPLIKSDSGLELLFTVRSTKLAKHSGEIAFPGGRLDDGETLIDAAVRETFEEIGLQVSRDAILGFLDDRPSPFEYVVTPVLALTKKPEQFDINDHEVTEVFSVPLYDLQQITPRVEERFIREQKRHVYFYPYQDRLIWGLTGNIVKNLLDILYAVSHGIIK